MQYSISNVMDGMEDALLWDTDNTAEANYLVRLWPVMTTVLTETQNMLDEFFTSDVKTSNFEGF